MTTAPLHRWKSSASRSSFGSIMTHDVPRSPRSRASSTETETSTLRKRRKVRHFTEITLINQFLQDE